MMEWEITVTVADGTGAVGDSLADRLNAVQGSLDTLEREISRENRLRSERIAASENKARWLTRAVVLALFVGLVGVVVGIRGVAIGNEAHAAQRAASATTADARLGACTQQRVAADIAIAASHSHDVVLADTLAPTPRSPRDEARVQKYLADAHASDVLQYRKRDCSPNGIQAFYSGRGGYEPLPKG